MEWNMIVTGMSLISLAVGLTIGLILPRNMLVDAMFNELYFLFIFIITIIGIVFMGDGLRK